IGEAPVRVAEAGARGGCAPIRLDGLLLTARCLERVTEQQVQVGPGQRCSQDPPKQLDGSLVFAGAGERGGLERKEVRVFSFEPQEAGESIERLLVPLAI